MSLNEQLEQVAKGAENRYPEEFIEGNWRDVLRLKEQRSAAGLKVGEKAPDFTLNDATGKGRTLSENLKYGPVVLSFYRGSWCPYCSLELRALRKIHSEIDFLGASLMAISPEKPDLSLSLAEKENLPFPVLSDSAGEVMLSYRLIWEFSDELREQFLKHLDVDLRKTNEAGWVVPVPATFIIDVNAVVRERYVNEIFIKRMEPSGILSALKKL